MAYTFTQVVNRLGNGKCLTRPGWSGSGKYIVSPLNFDGVLTVYPSNTTSPAQVYCPTMSDLNATDWVDAT